MKRKKKGGEGLNTSTIKSKYLAINSLFAYQRTIQPHDSFGAKTENRMSTSNACMTFQPICYLDTDQVSTHASSRMMHLLPEKTIVVSGFMTKIL